MTHHHQNMVLSLGLVLLPVVGCGGIQHSLEQYLPKPVVVKVDEDARQAELMDRYMSAVVDWDFALAQDCLDTLREENLTYDISLDHAQAYIYLRLGRYDDALTLINSFHPEIYDTNGLTLRAEALNEMHRYNEARQDLDTVLLGRPRDSGYVHMLLREMALKLGDIEQVRMQESILFEQFSMNKYGVFVALYRSIKDRDFLASREALDRLSTVVRTEDDPEIDSDYYATYILYARAVVAYQQDDYDRAIDIFQGITEEIPLATGGWPDMTWLALVYGYPDDAREWAIEGIVCCGGKGILEELGIEVDEEITEKHPDPGPLRHHETAQLLIYLGRTSLMMGNADECAACCEKAIEVNKYHLSSYLVMSNALEYLGDPAEALEIVVSGLMISPTCDELVPAYARLADEAPQAIPPNTPDPGPMFKDLLRKIRLMYEEYPLDPSVAHSLAYVLDEMDDESALEFYTQAHETLPNRYDYTSSLAQFLAGSGDLEGAIATLDDFDIPLSLPRLVQLYEQAASDQLRDLYLYTGWLRDRMDPEDEFAELLDPLAQEAQSALSKLESSEDEDDS